MWFLIAILILLWLICLITFSSTAYWVHGFLGIAIVLFVFAQLRRRKAKV